LKELAQRVHELLTNKEVHNHLETNFRIGDEALRVVVIAHSLLRELPIHERVRISGLLPLLLPSLLKEKVAHPDRLAGKLHNLIGLLNEASEIVTDERSYRQLLETIHKMNLLKEAIGSQTGDLRNFEERLHDYLRRAEDPSYVLTVLKYIKDNEAREEYRRTVEKIMEERAKSGEKGEEDTHPTYIYCAPYIL